MEPELIINSEPLDFELAELLGEKPGDFLVLCFDGVQFEGFGTPPDTPQRRKEWEEMVSGLNDRSKKSWWPKMVENWGPVMMRQFQLDAGMLEVFRPVVSFKVSRVCAAYSTYLPVAVRLFEMLGERVSSWEIGKGEDGRERAVIYSAGGRMYMEVGQGLPGLIGLVVKRLLVAEPLGGEPNPQLGPN